MAEQLHSFAMKRQLEVWAEYIPGELNRRADRVSRIREDYSDKQLHPELFCLVQRAFGPLKIDLFASRMDRQVRDYVSLRAEKSALYQDAFSLPLPRHQLLWANPPYIMIGRLLAKIRRERATNVVVLAPFWESAPWWPLLRELLVDRPLLLPRGPGMFINPLTQEEVQEFPKWEVLAWRLSGERSQVEEFRRTLSHCTSNHLSSPAVRCVYTNAIGVGGSHFVATTRIARAILEKQM